MEYFSGTRMLSGKMILRIDAKNKEETKKALEIAMKYIDSIADESESIHDFVTELYINTLKGDSI